MKRWLLFFALLLALSAYALARYLPQLKATAEVSVMAQRAVTGPFLREVTGSGEVKASDSATLAFKDSGAPVAELFVQEGEAVSKGQVLARLDSSAKQSQLTAEKLNLQNQRAKRASSPENDATREIELQSRLKSATTDIAKTQNNLQAAAKKDALAAKLLAAGVSSRDERARAVDALNDLKVQLEQQESRATLARRELLRFQESRGADTLALDADIARLEASVRGLEAQLAASELRAPFSGVIAKLPFVVGEAAGSKGIEMINPNKLYVEARFAETRAAELRAKQPAKVIPDADPNLSLNATIGRVGVTATRDSNGQGAYVSTVLALSADASSSLKAGYSVAVIARVAYLQRALQVPLEALSSGAVYKIAPQGDHSGRVERVPVTVLARSDLLAAVRPHQALKAGDLLASTSLDALREGAAVTFTTVTDAPTTALEASQ